MKSHPYGASLRQIEEEGRGAWMFLARLLASHAKGVACDFEECGELDCGISARGGLQECYVRALPDSIVFTLVYRDRSRVTFEVDIPTAHLQEAT